jgi:4-hydroxy-tetrahydrodipicolinate reductase
MKTVIIGYGTMGHEIERVLIDRGHTVLFTVDAGEEAKLATERLAQADVAIEFTTPATAFGNVETCLRAGVPVVCGTTGWNERREEAEKLCEELDGTFFWSSNFSIGVNILFRVSEYLARIMDRFPEYAVSMREVHHTRKKDAPSGTAVTLAEGILRNIGRTEAWVNHETDCPSALGIVSVREGDVAGIHEVIYYSVADTITLCHEAKGRRGFAVGAVMAAEFAAGHKGVLTMDDMLGSIIH